MPVSEIDLTLSDSEDEGAGVASVAPAKRSGSAPGAAGRPPAPPPAAQASGKRCDCSSEDRGAKRQRQQAQQTEAAQQEAKQAAAHAGPPRSAQRAASSSGATSSSSGASGSSGSSRFVPDFVQHGWAQQQAQAQARQQQQGTAPDAATPQPLPPPPASAAPAPAAAAGPAAGSASAAAPLPDSPMFLLHTRGVEEGWANEGFLGVELNDLVRRPCFQPAAGSPLSGLSTVPLAPSSVLPAGGVSACWPPCVHACPRCAPATHAPGVRQHVLVPAQLQELSHGLAAQRLPRSAAPSDAWGHAAPGGGV